MKFYVARDLTGALYLFNEKPVYHPQSGGFLPDHEFYGDPFDMLKLDDEMFPQIKTKDSPKEVQITLVYECGCDIEKGGENG